MQLILALIIAVAGDLAYRFPSEFPVSNSRVVGIAVYKRSGLKDTGACMVYHSKVQILHVFLGSWLCYSNCQCCALVLTASIRISVILCAQPGKELTPADWDTETAGKTVFIKFLAPWCPRF